MFFFFKQKTAYEMRISDWSSDMCSSDLDERRLPAEPLGQQDQTGQDKAGRRHLREPEAEDRLAQGPQPPRMQFEPDEEKQEGDPDFGDRELRFAAADQPQSIGSDERAGDQIAEHRAQAETARSEEHTSELQSLMRTSYAVFCLKKKKK